MIIPVILSGGSGTRLWPLSRKNLPKQFLPLAGDTSLFQQTVDRARRLADSGAPILVWCSEDHRFLVAEHLFEMKVGGASIMLEPAPRNTAPAVALAALQALSRDPDAVMLVLPADHLIGDTESFQGAVDQALPIAQQDWLVTFGIRPDAPETGFGYIRRGDALDEGFRVARFVEKPDAATAKTYIDDGNYDWNSGMFLFRASRYMTELERHAPAIVQATRASFATATADLDFVRIDKAAFNASPEDSIDYAVMEKTDRAAVVPVSCGWSDIGSWAALWSAADKDADGSDMEGDVIAIDSHNCLVRAADRRLIATIGVDDLVVIDTPDATLVAFRNRSQDVKKLVDQLKAADRTEHVFHRKAYRPWGSYDSIDMGERSQVKRIVVKPGAALSLQKHHHRAEHWIVVSGTAEVTRDEEVFLLSENPTTYLPLGSVHRLSYVGKVPLELVEVQSGGYLGEDDIVRFEDVYGRA